MNWKLGLPAIYVIEWQVAYHFHLPTWIPLLLMLPIPFLFRQKYFGDVKWPYAVFLSLTFSIFLVFPALLSGTLKFSFFSGPLLESLFYSALLSVTLLPSVFASIMDTGKRNFVWQMVFCGIAYFLVLTPIKTSYTAIGVAQILLYNVSFDVALSLYIAFLYLTENRKLVGPTIFLFGYTVFSSLALTDRVSELFTLVWEIISISILFWLTYFLLGKNRWVRKLLKTKKRIILKKKTSKRDIVFTGLVIALAIGLMAGYYTHTVSADPTSSMYPVITPGSMLFIEPATPGQVQLGNIIEFHAPWANGTLFAHKVVDIVKENGTTLFRTRGINNPVNDPQLVPGSDLVGIVKLHVPYLGYAFIYAKVTAAVIVSLLIGSILVEGTLKGNKH